MQKDIDFSFIYRTREEAYKELFELLPTDVEFDSSWKIITTTINNLPQVLECADKLSISCEPFFIEEVKAPNNPECAIATVSELKEIVMEQNLVKSFEISEDFIYDMSEKIFQNSILSKLYAFKGGNPIGELSGKNIMIFSDGCETGLTTMCAVKSLLNAGVKKIFFFTPIISEDLYEGLGMIVDKVCATHKIKDFIRSSYYYEDFSDVDIEVLRYEIEKRRK